MLCSPQPSNDIWQAMPITSSPATLQLASTALIGKGLHRECFVHPHDPALCVKIVVAGTGNENVREQACYALLDRRGVSWEMLPRFHGIVATSLGEGAVFDLIRDYDGGISLTLAHYLSSQQLTAQYGATLRGALHRMKRYLLEHRIITMTLKPKNILFQRETADSGKLVIVDNIGNSDFIPLANYSASLARWKIERKWRRFEISMRRDYTGNDALHDALD